LPRARQAYAQSIKQSQIEDLQYRASLLPEDKQDAYIRSQGTAMLRGNKLRYWSDDERGAFEQQIKSGNIGTLGNFALSFVKPFAQGVGGYIGSPLGPAGTIVGSQIGGTLGESLTTRLRRAMGTLNLDPVSQQITLGVPPPPSAQTSAPRPSISPTVAPAAAPIGAWRPVQPNEIFTPGNQFRMNQTTGQSEVYQPPRPMVHRVINGQAFDAQGNPITFPPLP
jgi:hypothetical protein